MKNSSRRDFIKRSSMLASGSLLVPNFLKAMNATNSNLTKGPNGKILVVIQLSGGNDGLNTIIPYRNDIYYRERPQLAIEKRHTLKATDELGFNNSMNKFKELFEEGYVSIINNVGYPNPNRSHFRSMDIWHTASNSHEYLSTGWIGRYLDASCEGCAKPHDAVEISDSLSLALKGKDVKGLAMRSPQSLYRSISTGSAKDLSQLHQDKHHENDQLHYLYKTLIETTSSVDYIHEHSKIYKSKVPYPQNPFARQLKTIAEMIGSGIDTKVYYASLAGFDTHIRQKMQQERLLQTYSDAVHAFIKELKEYNRFNDVMILTFSEFGRRVKQNASQGTDHGTANNLFIMNGNLQKPGFYNEGPNLKNLDAGDLIYDIDFRCVYATLLDKWLDIDAKVILGGEFEGLGFV
ncbi:DUF1501 domain-containing protein [Fulvivirgaceae bacterium BMA10]|uniref:DUF1501 domain-containing protein n=1 Tax=Splendidivirga corallicola TaxID=3051826 RepID=A0ABT8KSQ6_9BACT|nr:DUF1501 domain-containing protein [Fulvivirgaceae bacterium BMA10]